MENLTLVRLWLGTETELPNAFVEWNDGEFYLPDDDPMAKALWRDPAHAFRVIVSSTDELMWVVDRIDVEKLRFADRGDMRVICKPYMDWLRSRILPDENLIYLWLEAEKHQPASTT
jgi:hypothetical protein